jgi:hypothetical protein
MKEVIKRIVIERNDLLDKCSSLEAFIDSDKFNDVNYVQQLLLPSQLSAMETYLMLLDARLDDLEEPFND